MSDIEKKSRRQFFTNSAAALAAVAAGGTALGQVVRTACQITPPQTEGPFYPVKEQPDEDNDLTAVKGVQGTASGKVIFILGAVTDENCQPVSGALVEIWQACATGKYNHPNDTNPAALDPKFQYWGKCVTDNQGRYRFKTILPGAYPADTNWTRPPHVHFKVHKLGYHELTTQMYFQGQPLNSRDLILKALTAAQQAQVIVPLELLPGEDPKTRSCRFNLSLSRVR